MSVILLCSAWPADTLLPPLFVYNGFQRLKFLVLAQLLNVAQ